jgi:ferritin-like metal-binding protein YciE
MAAAPKSTKVPLFLWRAPWPRRRSPVDHTWVSTYGEDAAPHNSIQQVIDAAEYFWYCWGLFYAFDVKTSSRVLASQVGELAIATCIARPNVSCEADITACGTIFEYGDDGLCYQLTNQVLYSTRIGATLPLRTVGARGYQPSTYLYGTYGLNEEAWEKRHIDCGNRTAEIGTRVMTEIDDFKDRAREVLGKSEPGLLKDLLTLRESIQNDLKKERGTRTPSEQNQRNQKMLDQAAKLLGPSHFEMIFGYDPAIRMDLVYDPVAQTTTSVQPGKKSKNKDLNDLFLDTLKDIYFAEKQILKALPKMAKAAQSDKLRAAFEKHHGETEGQVDRLEQVFKILGAPARGKTCDAIKGILDEGKEIMDEYKGCEALDAGLLAAAQAVEHYEISRYGTLKQWALQLGMKDAARLLDQTLQQEKKTDAILENLAGAQYWDEAISA